jgi:hypothetical protein
LLEANVLQKGVAANHLPCLAAEEAACFCPFPVGEQVAGVAGTTLGSLAAPGNADLRIGSPSAAQSGRRLPAATGPAAASSAMSFSPRHPAIGTVRYPRLVPRDAACAAKLKPRTLTNLYNQRPTWLDLAHPLATTGPSACQTSPPIPAAPLRLPERSSPQPTSRRPVSAVQYLPDSVSSLSTRGIGKLAPMARFTKSALHPLPSACP